MPPRPPLFDPQGRSLVERRGLPRHVASTLGKDAYHFLRTTTWPRLFAILGASWIACNLLFAALLYFGGAEILNARPGSFVDRFWFSVQTMATIGYGYMAPQDALAHAVVTVE